MSIKDAHRRALAEMWQEECDNAFEASPLQHIRFKLRLYVSRVRAVWAVIRGRAIVHDKLLP